MQTKSSISVLDGTFFDILKPKDYPFKINTIATALSNLCRYTGHVTRFYSVAEHSVLVSMLVPRKHALAGLLHDSAEAFLGDVSSPLKKLLPQYQRIEDRVEKAIAKHFQIEYPYHEEIHLADKRMYWNERKTIAPAKDTLWHQELGAARKVEAVGLVPAEAKKLFLNRYYELIENDERYAFLREEAAA